MFAIHSWRDNWKWEKSFFIRRERSESFFLCVEKYVTRYLVWKKGADRLWRRSQAECSSQARVIRPSEIVGNLQLFPIHPSLSSLTRTWHTQTVGSWVIASDWSKREKLKWKTHFGFTFFKPSKRYRRKRKVEWLRTRWRNGTLKKCVVIFSVCFSWEIFTRIVLFHPFLSLLSPTLSTSSVGWRCDYTFNSAAAAAAQPIFHASVRMMVLLYFFRGGIWMCTQYQQETGE